MTRESAHLNMTLEAGVREEDLRPLSEGEVLGDDDLANAAREAAT